MGHRLFRARIGQLKILANLVTIFFFNFFSHGLMILVAVPPVRREGFLGVSFSSSISLLSASRGVHLGFFMFSSRCLSKNNCLYRAIEACSNYTLQILYLFSGYDTRVLRRLPRLPASLTPPALSSSDPRISSSKSIPCQRPQSIATVIVIVIVIVIVVVIVIASCLSFDNLILGS